MEICTRPQEPGPVVVPEPRFARREIVSNWTRYEGLDAAGRDAAGTRGADFNTLLTASGQSSLVLL